MLNVFFQEFSAFINSLHALSLYGLYVKQIHKYMKHKSCEPRINAINESNLKSDFDLVVDISIKKIYSRNHHFVLYVKLSLSFLLKNIEPIRAGNVFF